MTDPRVERTKSHPLINIIVITLCAVISGADNWVDIEEFGKAKAQWLRRYVAMTHGVPSHDTFGRVFARLDPEEFERCLRSLRGK